MIQECRPCSTTQCSVTPDSETYSLEGIPPHPLPPVVDPVAPPFANAVVYYTCAVGLTIGFTGTLPAWITVDSVNNRLVGAAGTFRGNTKAQATALAQANMDAFAAAQIVSGDLTCSSCPAAAATKTIPIVWSQIFYAETGLAFCTSNQKGFVSVSNGNEFAIVDYGALSSAVFANGMAFVFDGFDKMVYSPVQDKIYGAGTNTTVNNNIWVRVILPDGTLSTLFDTGITNFGTAFMCYDDVNDRIVVTGRSSTAGVQTFDIGVFDCATLGNLYLALLGVASAGMSAVTYCAINNTYYAVATTAGQGMWKITAGPLVATQTVLGTRSGDITWISELDLLVLRASASNTTVFVDRATEAVVSDTGYGGGDHGAVYNPCTNEIQVSEVFENIICFDDTTYLETRQMLAFKAQALYYDPVTNQTLSVGFDDQNAYAVS